MNAADLRQRVPGAGAEALAMLDPSRGALESPIRAEIFGAERFGQHGRSLGLTHEARLHPARTVPFFPRLHDNIRVLREAHHYIGLQDRIGHHVSPAGEWLLDNFHLVQAQIKAIHDGLPRRYFRDLPVLVEAPLAGLPRIYGVAWAFVAHTDSAFSEPLLVEFLRAYQETRELTLGELWALPTTLRVVLIENLRRLSESVATLKAAREIANLWCDRLDARTDIDVQPMFEAMRERGVGTAFALQVMQRLHSDSGSLQGLLGREAVRAALARALPDPAGAQARQQSEAAADNLSVSSAINSLRQLGDADWRSLIGTTSALMGLMAGSAVFSAERDDTQDATLHAIERLARRSGRSEREVAGTLLGLMRAPPARLAAAAGPAVESPSWWLRGRGCRALRHAVGLRPSLLPRGAPWRQRLTLPAYLAALAVCSLGLTAWFVSQWGAPDARSAALFALALLAFWPASEAVIAVVNRLISESVPPRRLPRLALEGGIPPEHRVLVVVPAMLTHRGGIEALVRQLERHALANREPHAQFALLSDYVDADAACSEGDAALLAEAIDAIERLERRHRGGAPTPPDASADAPRRFLLLHRDRQWSPTEQRWIGWERKRGKIEQLIALLAGEGPSAFVDLGALSRPHPGTPYVVTLDSDTVLPPGALHALVGVAAHPLNRPRIDAQRRRVSAGYGILQPRLVTPLPDPGQATPFHALFAGRCGVDPYSAATSEVYQDLFDEGTFTGKGLLDVQAMHAVLGGRLPEGQVLSHDLIEGALARCGGVSDITLIEDAPLHADVAASRVHRWTRGDWQLWPLLLQRGLGLRAVNRWKMVDNLRRSLVAPLSVVLLVASLAGAPVSPWAVLALVALAYGGGPLLGAVAGLAPSRDDVALIHFYRQAGADVGRAAGALAWNLALLLHGAMSLADAIVRAVWRMTVSRRGLLQWTTAAAAQASAKQGLRALARRHRPVALAALALLAALAAVGTPAPGLAVALCLLWAATPVWIWWGSRPRPAPAQAGVNPADRDYLLGVARDAWLLFERHVGPDSHDLPPDNVQTVPHLMVAQRTSPTNIGLYLLAAACAERFGWIGTAELVQRLERTLATLARLPRHRGHLLNWIDVQTLQPLLPAYVSTVDSGNLCVHLAAVAGACEERARAPLQDGALAPRLRTLAAECRRVAGEAEFGFLFDARRRLFHIGWRVAQQQLDQSFYDLLASESRLASLWAIAKGDVPVSHWAALGRPFYADGVHAGLRSWSGSMFEYLMPVLVLHEPAGSALASAAGAAVHEQIAQAQALGLPWGVSESAYAAVDASLAYQYAPQGVPRLALRRTPPDERVVAPYATALAAMFEPQAALANLRRLQAEGARGELGFIEALDYTADRQTGGGACTPVSTFMAHHQGMSIVALANLLLQGAPQRWGMSDAAIGAVSSLLQERVPREVSQLLDPPPAPSRGDRRDIATGAHREMVPGAAALQPTHLLANGRYSVALRANGAGWSRLNGVDVSRWRDDALRDAHGTFFYLRRRVGAAPVSITQHPAPDPTAHYEADFHADHVCLGARWPGLRSLCTVWVSPEDDIEMRRVELWNTSSLPQSLELSSMFEVALADARADEMHPAFGKLFVHAEWVAAERALYFARRPRLATESALHAVHFLAHADATLAAVQAQTDRARWLGRRREAGFPLAAFGPDGDAPGTRDTGLDPVAALSMRIELPPHGTAQVTVCTAAAASRAELQTLVDRYRQPAHIERSTMMSSTFATLRLREMRMGVDDRAAMQTLTTPMALLLARPAAAAGSADPAGCDRRALWRLGISGDRPIAVVTASTVQGLRVVRSMLQALRGWSWGGLVCDLVVVDAEPRSYLMPLQLELRLLAERYASEVAATPAARQGGLHIVHADELSTSERATLALLARVRLHADGRSLAQHVQELADWHDAALDARQGQNVTALPAPAPIPLDAGAGSPLQGRFDAAGGAFRFEVDAGSCPQRPWVNVLANTGFGAQVSEAGAGWTWAGNSRLHQLTPWSNDPVSDGSGESFFLQDLRTREVRTLGGGAGGPDGRCEVEHGQGVTTLRQRHCDIEVVAGWCVDPRQPLKQVRIVLRNAGRHTQRLRVLGVFEWVMGSLRADRQSVRTSLASLPPTGLAASPAEVLLATQDDAQGGPGGGTAFVGLRCSARADATLPEWTCDRRELFDARGRRVVPDLLEERAGAGLDPCAAVATTLALAPGASAECVFLIGHGDTPAAASALAFAALEQPAMQREGAARARWDELLGALVVHSPDPLFDALVNRWLPYQTVACRLWARAGFYQAGGAYGFRDQLQDAMAMAVTAPQLLRGQLLRAASRQFVEGDVQHWWHEPGGAGVRTRFSDDLLWLPYAAAHHCEVTGDAGVLDETVAFIEGGEIPDGAEDLYETPRVSLSSATLYEHGARCIDRSMAVGAHGLPLMGSGDWNDGMNRVGHEGRGESVWLGWFLCAVVAAYAPIARRRGESSRALRWEAAANGWRLALQGAAWDGAWFTRAYFDDGSALGSHANAEARIDLIAQAWAVLSGAATPQQQSTAMASAQRLLVDDDGGLIRLLDPPLAQSVPEAGYIQAYPAGVRENGGQYNHAGVWWLMAQAAQGDAAGAWTSFTRLSPAHRSQQPRQAAAYGLEPYAMAADIYTQPPYVGRGGWSWYTGSAAWLHRAAVESIVGLHARGNRVRFTPLLPPHWPEVTLELRRHGRHHEFVVCAAAARAHIDRARARDARALAPGDWLDLAAAGNASRHLVIAAAPPPAAGDAVSSYTAPGDAPMGAVSSGT